MSLRLEPWGKRFGNIHLPIIVTTTHHSQSSLSLHHPPDPEPQSVQPDEAFRIFLIVNRVFFKGGKGIRGREISPISGRGPCIPFIEFQPDGSGHILLGFVMAFLTPPSPARTSIRNRSIPPSLGPGCPANASPHGPW